MPRSGPSPAPPHPALRVLVVDDHTDAADVLGELLRIHGHHCTVVYDGMAALCAVEAGSYDLALIDLDLPQMDGYALARLVLATAARPPQVLVAVTGAGGPAAVAEVLASGFHEHLLKPLSLDALAALLARVAMRVGSARHSNPPVTGEHG